MSAPLFLTMADAEDGFSLAGLEQILATPASLPGILAEVMAQGERRLVVVDQRLVTSSNQEWLAAWERSFPGLVVLLPGPALAGEEDKYVQRLIRQAIGYHLRTAAG